MKIKPLTLVIEKELWDKFKEKVPRTIKLNDAVVDLIKEHISKRKNSIK